MAKSENPARVQAAANTRKLIDWAAGAIDKPLPEAVRRRAATILADDIGAIVAGSLEPQVARAREGLTRTASGTGGGDGPRAGRPTRRPLFRGERQRHGDHLVRARRGLPQRLLPRRRLHDPGPARRGGGAGAHRGGGAARARGRL